jgi:thymidylate kinase
LLLNAPPEVLWSRKQEVPFEEVVRQQKAYLERARRLKSVVIIDAAQPLETVIQQSLAAIIAHFSQRTMCRLGVPTRLGAPAGSEQG